MKASEIIELAKSEVGYCGKKSNKDLYDPTGNQLGLFTKYAQELYDAGYYNFNKSGYDYCCVFTDWLFFHIAGTKEEAIKVKPYNLYNAGITWSKKSFVDVGRIINSPKPGACIYFLDKSKELAHTGLVIEVGDDYITTVEGNVSKKVVQKTYKINDPCIDSYGWPFYEEEPEPPTPVDDWDTLAEWKDIDGHTLRLQKSK